MYARDDVRRREGEERGACPTVGVRVVLGECLAQAEMEVVKSIKENACYIAFNPQKEEAQGGFDKTGGGYPYQLPDGVQIQVKKTNTNKKRKSLSTLDAVCHQTALLAFSLSLSVSRCLSL